MIAIGIAGGSGSGKSTLTRSLEAAMGADRVSILPLDAYYRARSDHAEAVEEVNQDEPAAFDFTLLIDHLAALARGETVDRPVYDFTRHDRSPLTERVASTPVVIVEGILVLAHEPLRRVLDLKLWVDAPADVRLARRVERDVRERGRSAASVIDRFHRHVAPMHALHGEPSRRYADLIVPGGGENPVAIDVLSGFLRDGIAPRNASGTS